MIKHKLIKKSVFFPEQGILAIGDLHIGYEHALQQSGVLMPENQVKEVINDLTGIIKEIKKNKWKLKKIVFLGDIKHYFGYEWKERFNFNKILNFLGDYIKDSDIILIKGNHDKFDFSGKKMKNYYFNNGIMFFHGHMSYPQIFEPRISAWVIGHLHPSVRLSEKKGVKKENYKCYLIGSYKNKQIFVLPSFFGAVEGTPVNEIEYNNKDFSIIPNSVLKDFKVNAIADNGEIFEFGKVKSLS